MAGAVIEGAEAGAAPVRPRRVPQPADLRLRHAKTYTRLRRLALAITLLMLVLAPLFALRAAECTAALGGESRWAELARAVGLPCETPEWIGAPWAVRVLSIDFVDPLAAAGVVLAGGASWKLAMGALLPLVLVILFGRFFCGWICPYVPILAVSNATRALLARLGLRTMDVELPRRIAYGVLAALLAATALSGSQLAPLVYPPSVIGREVFRAVFFGAFGAGAIFVLAAFAFDTFVSRAGFCRSLCPGGATFRLLGRRSLLVVRREAAKCTDCTACDVVCNLGQAPMTDRLDDGCERCGKCIAVCPTDALRMSVEPARLVQIGRRGEGRR